MDEDDLRQNAQELSFFKKQYNKDLGDLNYSIIRTLKAERTRLQHDYRHNWAISSPTFT